VETGRNRSMGVRWHRRARNDRVDRLSLLSDLSFAVYIYYSNGNAILHCNFYFLIS
jgi:hypothetical protein